MACATIRSCAYWPHVHYLVPKLEGASDPEMRHRGGTARDLRGARRGRGGCIHGCIQRAVRDRPQVGELDVCGSNGRTRARPVSGGAAAAAAEPLFCVWGAFGGRWRKRTCVAEQDGHVQLEQIFLQQPWRRRVNRTGVAAARRVCVHSAAHVKPEVKGVHPIEQQVPIHLRVRRAP